MQTDTHKTTLEHALQNVTHELESIATFDTASGDWVAIPDTDEIGNADDNVEADAVETWNERRALMAQLEIRYRNITRALTKFETEAFGVCEICKEEIEPERLAVNPAARTCLAHLEREKELPL